MAIRSPFEGPNDFDADLRMEPDRGWFDGLLDVGEVLDLAPFRATGILRNGTLRYEYSFQPPPSLDRVDGRVASRVMPISIRDPELQRLSKKWSGIGAARLDLYVFDREPQILAATTQDRAGLKEFLDNNGGVRVYRDGVRVYNYGEPENDWLDLGGQRVNVPSRRIGNNQVIGAVSLSLAESGGLVEKTNREGFVENPTYELFRESVAFAIRQIEADRNEDKSRMRIAYSGRRRQPVIEDLADLRDRLHGNPDEADLAPYIDRIERQFRDVQERLLTAAGAGLSMAMVVHQLEKGVAELTKALDRDVEVERIRQLAVHLEEMIDGLSYLTRRSGMSQETAATLVRYALFNTEYRLEYHKIASSNGLDTTDENFKTKCHRRLIIATLMNLIDNSIWWLRSRGRGKRIHLGTTDDIPGGATLFVADNGPGFVDPPETLIEPFITRRPDGMGLGLYLANEVMKVHRGRLVFPEPGDLELPSGINGAIVGLQFPEAKWMD
jgi:signal transduction histidine kinase